MIKPKINYGKLNLGDNSQ